MDCNQFFAMCVYQMNLRIVFYRRLEGVTEKVSVEAHGGNIWAENNVDREGATFSFSVRLQLHASV